MQGGDISNEVTPRLLVVFEGLIGVLPPQAARREAIARKMHQWSYAVSYWEIHEGIGKAIWDQVWRFHRHIDVVTFLGKGFAEALEARLDDEQLPTGRVLSTTPDRLARQIASMPDVAAVYDPEPTRRFRYGGKGRHIAPDQFSYLGT